MSRLRALVFRLYGAPPPRGAPRAVRLRWIRSFYFKMAPLTCVVYVMLCVWATETWIFVLLALNAVIGLQSVVSLSVKIRREERGGS
jgi:hypothetical protein